jgi:hypothetical protein
MACIVEGVLTWNNFTTAAHCAKSASVLAGPRVQPVPQLVKVASVRRSPVNERTLADAKLPKKKKTTKAPRGSLPAIVDPSYFSLIHGRTPRFGEPTHVVTVRAIGRDG